MPPENKGPESVPLLPAVKPFAAGQWGLMRAFMNYTAREKQFILSEIVQVKGLMPLLMKQRNRQRWTPDEKAELAAHLKRLSRLSPYMAMLVLPGGFLMLPAVAWWLDRRRNRKAPSAS